MDLYYSMVDILASVFSRGRTLFQVGIVGSNFFWIRTRSIKLFRTHTRTFFFQNFFKFETERRSEDAGCFHSITYLKLAHLVYFSGNFEGNFIKIKSYLVFIMRRRSSGPKKLDPDLDPVGSGSGSGIYPTISNSRGGTK
jgi:hypothetical protein